MKNGMTNRGKDDMRNGIKNADLKAACPLREQLMAYSTRLLQGPEVDAVRRHLDGCAACRAVAYEYRAIDSFLGEWKTPDPSPGFDARVRAAVAEQANAPGPHASGKPARGLFSLFGRLGLGRLNWTSWPAPLATAALVVVVSVVAMRVARNSHRGVTSGLTSGITQPAGASTAQASPRGSAASGPNAVQPPGAEAEGGEQASAPGPAAGEAAAEAGGEGEPVQAGQPGTTGNPSYAARAAQDDDMLANFDVLSELPPPPPGSQLAN